MRKKYKKELKKQQPVGCCFGFYKILLQA